MSKLKIESNIADLQKIINEIAALLEKYNSFELIVSVPLDPSVDSMETVDHYSSRA